MSQVQNGILGNSKNASHESGDREQSMNNEGPKAVSFFVPVKCLDDQIEQHELRFYPATSPSSWGRGSTPYSSRIGCLVDFCPECGGFIRVDQNHVDVVCQACGRIHETLYAYSFDPEAEHIKSRVEYVKKTIGKEFIQEIETRLKSAGIDLDGSSEAEKERLKRPYVRHTERNWNAVHIDQRVEDIVLDPRSRDQTSKVFGNSAFLAQPKLLKVYNDTLDENYAAITPDQLRASVQTRLANRFDQKIDRHIDEILRGILRPEVSKKIWDAQWAEEKAELDIVKDFWKLGGDGYLEKYKSSTRFVFEGTTRKLQPDHYSQQRIKDHQDKYLAKNIQEGLERKCSQSTERKYRVGNEEKNIKFTLYRVIRYDIKNHMDKITDSWYLEGDEIGEKFENFFFQEAFKRGWLGKVYDCRGTGKACHRGLVKAKEKFHELFNARRSGFIAVPHPYTHK
jgi:hypothetical protein